MGRGTGSVLRSVVETAEGLVVFSSATLAVVCLEA